MNQSARIWYGDLFRIGAEAGAAAGIVYLLVEELASVLHGAPGSAPLSLFASVFLGPAAFAAPPHPTTAALGGLVVLTFATMFGVAFSVFVHLFPGLAATPGTLVIAGATYGLLLWLFCFYLLGALLWPWFLQTNPTTQFVASVFGFGVVLGLGFVLAGVHRSPCLD